MLKKQFFCFAFKDGRGDNENPSVYAKKKVCVKGLFVTYASGSTHLLYLLSMQNFLCYVKYAGTYWHAQSNRSSCSWTWLDFKR